jgi:hypothetical protein
VIATIILFYLTVLYTLLPHLSKSCRKVSYSSVNFSAYTHGCNRICAFFSFVAETIFIADVICIRWNGSNLLRISFKFAILYSKSELWKWIVQPSSLFTHSIILDIFAEISFTVWITSVISTSVSYFQSIYLERCSGLLLWILEIFLKFFTLFTGTFQRFFWTRIDDSNLIFTVYGHSVSRSQRFFFLFSITFKVTASKSEPNLETLLIHRPGRSKVPATFIDLICAFPPTRGYRNNVNGDVPRVKTNHQGKFDHL